jgi:hypothetical protein
MTTLLLLPAGIALLLALDGVPAAEISALVLVVFIAAAVVVAVVGLVQVGVGIRAACPQCRRWWARVFLGERLVERKKCFGLVTRRRYTSSSGSVSLPGTSWQPDGLGRQVDSGSSTSSGTPSWQERVPVIRATYRVTYQCKHCAFRWSKLEVEQVEDFDIER